MTVVYVPLKALLPFVVKIDMYVYAGAWFFCVGACLCMIHIAEMKL